MRIIRQRLVGLTVAGSAIAAVAGWALGPSLVRAVFGPAIVLTPEVSLLIAVGSALAMGNLAFTSLAMAHDRTAAVVRSWLVAAVVAGVVIALLPTTPVLLACAAFLAAEAAAFVSLLLQSTRGGRTGVH